MHDSHIDLQPLYAHDGTISDVYARVFASAPNLAHQWLQINFGLGVEVVTPFSRNFEVHNNINLQGIQVVEVVKLISGQHLLQFRNTELRIGNEDESDLGLVPLTRNRLCGYYEGPDEEASATYVIDPTAKGRYLTLQTFHTDGLVVSEIYIVILEE